VNRPSSLNTCRTAPSKTECLQPKPKATYDDPPTSSQNYRARHRCSCDDARHIRTRSHHFWWSHLEPAPIRSIHIATPTLRLRRTRATH
jgi:hypothetical protein